MNTNVDVQTFWDVVNKVSCGVLEHHVGCSNHGATLGVKTPCGIDVTSGDLINFILFNFTFTCINLDNYLRCVC